MKITYNKFIPGITIVDICGSGRHQPEGRVKETIEDEVYVNRKSIEDIDIIPMKGLREKRSDTGDVYWTEVIEDYYIVRLWMEIGLHDVDLIVQTEKQAKQLLEEIWENKNFIKIE